MINVSDAVKTAYINGNADTEIFLTIGETEYDPTNILAGSVSIDESLCSAEQFDLSRVEKNQLTFTLFNISENISDLQGLTVVAKQRIYPDPSDHTTYTDIPLGTYEIVEAVNDGDYLFKCTCYDKAMLAFDTNIDVWWNTTVTFPVTLRTLATDLFDYLDVDYDIPNEFTNSAFSIVKRTVYFEGVTAAELLGYIQEVAGGYFKADRNGIISYYEAIPADEGLYPAVDLYPRDYLYPHNPHATAFGNPDTYQPQNYRFPQIVGDLEIADYWTAEIERVQVRGTEDDIGIIAGEGTNTYVIQGNPLLYNLTSETGATVVANILDAIDGVTYIPFKGRFMALPFLEVGDYAIIHTYKGLRVYSPIFSRTLSGSKLCFDTLESKGSQEIEQVTHVERSLKTLNQKTHELVVDVEGVKSTVSSLDSEINGDGGIAETVSTHTTQISQTANDINLLAKQTEWTTNFLYNSNFTDIESRFKFWELENPNTAIPVLEEYIVDTDFKGSNGYAMRFTQSESSETAAYHIRDQIIDINGINLNGKTVYFLFLLKLTASSKETNHLINRISYNTTSSASFVNMNFSWINVPSLNTTYKYKYSYSFTEDTYVKQIRVSIPYCQANETATYEVNNLCVIIQDSSLPAPDHGTWTDVAKTSLISQINISPNGVKIRGEKVDIYGLTTFHNGDGTGGTTINGPTISAGTVTGTTIEAGSVMKWNYTNSDSTTGTVTASVGNATTRLTANDPETWYGMTFKGSVLGSTSSSDDHNNAIIFDNKNFIVQSHQFVLSSQYGNGQIRAGIQTSSMDSSTGARVIIMCASGNNTGRITVMPDGLEAVYGGRTMKLDTFAKITATDRYGTSRTVYFPCGTSGWF